MKYPNKISERIVQFSHDVNVFCILDMYFLNFNH